jgi:hypothetical protein
MEEDKLKINVLNEKLRRISIIPDIDISWHDREYGLCEKGYYIEFEWNEDNKLIKITSKEYYHTEYGDNDDSYKSTTIKYDTNGYVHKIEGGMMVFEIENDVLFHNGKKYGIDKWKCLYQLFSVPVLKNILSDQMMEEYQTLKRKDGAEIIYTNNKRRLVLDNITL